MSRQGNVEIKEDEDTPCILCGFKTCEVVETHQRKYIACANCGFKWQVINGNLFYEVWGDDRNPREAGTTWCKKVPEGCLAVFQWDEV